MKSNTEGQARRERMTLAVLSVAEGWLTKLDIQLSLSVELGFAQQVEVEPALKEVDELQKMLVALKRKLSSFSPLATRHSPLSSRAGYAK
jgi:four helix bundle protein